MANSHFRKNTIARIKINGDWISDELKLRKGILDAFQAWLSDDMAWRAEIDGLPFSTLSPKETSSLELPFREEGPVFSIFHLLLADDTIIFYEAKADQLLYLSWVLL